MRVRATQLWPNNAGARWLTKFGQNDRPLTANEQLNFVKAVHAENRGTFFGFKIFGHARNLTHLLTGLTTFKPIVHVRLDDLKHFKSIKRAIKPTVGAPPPTNKRIAKRGPSPVTPKPRWISSSKSTGGTPTSYEWPPTLSFQPFKGVSDARAAC